MGLYGSPYDYVIRVALIRISLITSFQPPLLRNSEQIMVNHLKTRMTQVAQRDSTVKILLSVASQHSVEHSVETVGKLFSELKLVRR